MKELLLSFFYHKDYPGWKNIAEKLINNGECIMAGIGCIWIGGIGNFIQTEPAKDAIGCTLYKFDLNNFKTSEWFKEIKEEYLEDLWVKENNLKRELLSLQIQIKELDNRT